MKHTLLATAALVAASVPFAATSASASSHKFFKPHVYTGQIFGRSARASTGNPNIIVFDRRHEIGDVYQCSYITYQGQRAVVCD